LLLPICLRAIEDIEENGEQAGSFISSYEDYRYNLDKKTQDVCSEHALVFLDRNNQPLHRIPIVIIKNCLTSCLKIVSALVQTRQLSGRLPSAVV
jgi:Family of unknown function (DUF5895)